MSPLKDRFDKTYRTPDATDKWRSLARRLDDARQGRDCDELVLDANPRVHEEAAKSLLEGRGLCPSDAAARRRVAERLAKSPHPRVRAAVAEHGYSVRALSDDESPIVRYQAARHASGDTLEKLANDESGMVRGAASEREAAIAADSSFGYDTPYTALDDYKSQAEAFSRDVVGRSGPDAEIEAGGRARGTR